MRNCPHKFLHFGGKLFRFQLILAETNDSSNYYKFLTTNPVFPSRVLFQMGDALGEFGGHLFQISRSGLSIAVNYRFATNQGYGRDVTRVNHEDEFGLRSNIRGPDRT